MSDLPEVKAYRATRSTYTVNGITTVNANVDVADAAIEAQEKRIAELEADPYKGQWKRKYMQVKAERDEWEKTQAMTQQVAERLQAERDHARDIAVALECENARLQVCGTCGWRMYACCKPNGERDVYFGIGDHDSCRLTPSRWQPYWEGEG